MEQSQIVSCLWGVADLVRDTFKRGKYQDIILPLTVRRRLDWVLADTKERVLAKQAELSGKLENLDAQLRRASGYAFYTTSHYDFDSTTPSPSWTKPGALSGFVALQGGGSAPGSRGQRDHGHDLRRAHPQIQRNAQ
jgi:type I restriction-modification system DNA methylase subunit